jgi:hypothetical protein
MRFVDDTDPERARVSISKQTSAPMVVDWNPENRADLEVTARRGPALVHFDATTFELLPDCKAGGVYSYVGVTPKEQHVTVRSRAELHTNMPLGAFKLEGMLDDKGSLSVDMRMVGKQVLDRPTINHTELSGKRCERATHYVSSLTVGAFRFSSGASRAASASAGGLGIGAGGGVEKSEDTLQVDGDFGACADADPGASKSPAKCSAILRIEIVPLERDAAVAATDDRPRCGDGMRWNGEACVSLRRVEAEAKSQPASASGAPATGGFECDPRNGAECVDQCRAGNLPSCVLVGQLANVGANGVPHDPEKATKLWAAACKAGYAPGCTALSGDFQEKKKWSEALAFGRVACLAGDPAGCNGVAVQAFFGRGVKEDRATAYQLWVRACALRDWTSCSNAGVVLDNGLGGVAKDQVRARKLFELACSSPQKAGCDNLGNALELGLGGPPDLAKAMELYLADCDRGKSYACLLAGLFAEERGGKPEHKAKALSLFEKGCGYTETGGCLSEEEARVAYAGKYSAESIHRRACDGAAQPALACYNAAIAHERGFAGRVDLQQAGTLLRRACDAGLKKACRSPRDGTAGTAL